MVYEIAESQEHSPRIARKRQARMQHILRTAFAIARDEGRDALTLGRLAEELDAWDRLAKTYEQAIETVEDDFSQRQLLGSLADVYDQKLADPRSAIGALGRLNELDPDEMEPLDRMMMLCMLLLTIVNLATTLEYIIQVLQCVRQGLFLQFIFFQYAFDAIRVDFKND